MKVNGTRPPQARITVDLGEVDGEHIAVVVAPLPIGYDLWLDEHLPPPEPPFRDFARDEKGRFIRDPSGNPIPHHDRHDPDYVRRMARIEHYQMVLTVREALREDPNVEWETDPEEFSKKDFEDYAQALAEEVEASLEAAQVAAILRASNDLSDLMPRLLEDAGASFRDEGRADVEIRRLAAD